MKKKIKNIMVLLMTFLILTPNITTFATNMNTEKAYMKKYDKIISNMKKDMQSIKATGYPALDFLCEMMPHHEAGISMAKNVLKYTENDELKKIANTIIKEQGAEVQKMKEIIKCLKEKPLDENIKEEEYLKVYDCILKKMIEGLEKANTLTGCVDVDFLQQMIIHHEGGIAMAKNILKNTTNKEIREISENIVKTQEVQVKEMRELLKNYK
ncbi:MAG: DUF305 domain-containing protein [Clostridium sp.]